MTGVVSLNVKNVTSQFEDLWVLRMIKNPDNLPYSELLAVPKRETDEFEDSKWSNRDLIPTPKDRQTWTAFSYFGYWCTAAMGIPTWSMGSTALTYGLSCQQALIAFAVGWSLVGILCVLIGMIGQKWRIGYTVSSRAAYGFYGCYLPIALKSFVACIWQGLHLLYIGQGFAALFGALSPSALEGHLGTTFSDWSPLTRIELIGIFVGVILFAFVMMTPPEKMQLMVHISFVLQCGSFFGLLGWSLHANGGKLGPLWSQGSTSSDVGINPGWGIMYMITSICGSNSGILGQSDWTRYSKTKYAPNASQIISAPVTGFVTSAMGVFASAAMEPVLGSIYWNPVTLLPAILEYYNYNSASRAGVFFACFGIISGQLWQAVLLTACSTGMDVSGFSPKYINIRRGSYIMTIIGLLCQPWKLLATSNTFLTVISGFAVFVGPMVGIAVADFFFVRKMKYKLDELYRTEDSIYGYKYGINWRGMTAFTIGFAPTLPGLIMSASNISMSSGYSKFYNLTYLTGLFMSMFAHVVIHMIFPVPGIGEESPFLTSLDIDGINNDADSSTHASTQEVYEKFESKV